MWSAWSSLFSDNIQGGQKPRSSWKEKEKTRRDWEADDDHVHIWRWRVEGQSAAPPPDWCSIIYISLILNFSVSSSGRLAERLKESPMVGLRSLEIPLQNCCWNDATKSMKPASSFSVVQLRPEATISRTRPSAVANFFKKAALSSTGTGWPSGLFTFQECDCKGHRC